MSDKYLWADLVRLVMGTAALWLGALLLRIAWTRWRDHDLYPHIALYLSYALTMMLLCALRISHIGNPPTWDLWVAVVIVALGLWGAVRSVRIRRPRIRKRR